eukprot:12484-Rhodomonas_salina.1
MLSASVSATHHRQLDSSESYKALHIKSCREKGERGGLGAWVWGLGSRGLGLGSRVKGQGSRVGSRVKGQGSRVKGQGSRVK